MAEFIANEAGVPVDAITRQTRLWHDLRLGGDDAVEVFTRYQAQFGVDLASLQLTQHVPSEITVWYADAWESLACIFRFLPTPRICGFPDNGRRSRARCGSQDMGRCQTKGVASMKAKYVQAASIIRRQADSIVKSPITPIRLEAFSYDSSVLSKRAAESPIRRGPAIIEWK